MRHLTIILSVLAIWGCSKKQEISSEKISIPNEAYTNQTDSTAFIIQGYQSQNIKNFTIDTLCKGVRNSYECAKIIENFQIKNYPEHVSRNDSVLIIHLKNDKALTFRNTLNDDASDVAYTFREYFEKIGYFLIFIQYYEGFSYIMINDQVGELYYIDDLPIISPDDSKFVTASGDLMDEYNPNRIQIYNLGNEKIVLEWSFEPTEWEPHDPVWLGNETIRLTKYTFSAEKNGPVTLKSDKNSWKIIEPIPVTENEPVL